MGTIVTLSADRPRRRSSARVTEEATILLFMGVRYVRDPEPAPAMDRARPAKRTLDTTALELA